MTETMERPETGAIALTEDAAKETTAEKPTAPKPIETGGRGLELKTLDDYWRFALYVHASGLAPKGSEHSPQFDTPQKIFIAIQFGAELGLPPMRALDSVAVVNGRASLWGDAVLGICERSRFFDFKAYREWLTGNEHADDWTAHCQVRRHGSEAIERTFSVADAKRAQLWDNPKKPVWKQYPGRMLTYRARAFALRDAFPDVLRGLYSCEEMADVDTLLGQLDLEGSTAPQTSAQAVTQTAKEQVARLREKGQAKMEKPAPEPPKPPPNETSTKGREPELNKALGETVPGKIRAIVKQLTLQSREPILRNHSIVSLRDVEKLSDEQQNDLLIELEDALETK